jgi:hypothetical protein
MRLVFLVASLAIVAGCATGTPTPARLSSAQILDLAKKELVECCGIAGPGYDISVSGNGEGWRVSAMPAHSYDEVEGTTILTAGGDVYLSYDAYGVLLHVFRGQ